MGIEQFVAERQARWEQLDGLLQLAESQPESDLGTARLLTLVRLYRLACSDLNRLRGLTANPELNQSLNQRVGRAYRFIYRRRSGGLAADGGWRTAAHRFWSFLRRDIPQAFAQSNRWIAVATLAFLAGGAVGFLAVLLDPAAAQGLIPDQFYSEDVAERVRSVESGPERVASAEDASSFGAMLYTHNIQVAFLGFSLSALTLVLGGVFLFYQGLILGATAAQYLGANVGTFFVAWVGPHGALEIPAIVFAGAAGMLVGKALLLPGEVGREGALRAVYPEAGRIMAACVFLLLGAGLIEGSFSQFSTRLASYGLKVALAGVLFGGMLFWLFGPTSRAAPRGPGSAAGKPAP